MDGGWAEELLLPQQSNGMRDGKRGFKVSLLGPASDRMSVHSTILGQNCPEGIRTDIAVDIPSGLFCYQLLVEHKDRGALMIHIFMTCVGFAFE